MSAVNTQLHTTVVTTTVDAAGAPAYVWCLVAYCAFVVVAAPLLYLLRGSRPVVACVAPFGYLLRLSAASLSVVDGAAGGKQRDGGGRIRETTSYLRGAIGLFAAVAVVVLAAYQIAAYGASVTAVNTLVPGVQQIAQDVAQLADLQDAAARQAMAAEHKSAAQMRAEQQRLLEGARLTLAGMDAAQTAPVLDNMRRRVESDARHAARIGAYVQQQAAGALGGYSPTHQDALQMHATDAQSDMQTGADYVRRARDIVADAARRQAWHLAHTSPWPPLLLPLPAQLPTTDPPLPAQLPTTELPPAVKVQRPHRNDLESAAAVVAVPKDVLELAPSQVQQVYNQLGASGRIIAVSQEDLKSKRLVNGLYQEDVALNHGGYWAFIYAPKRVFLLNSEGQLQEHVLSSSQTLTEAFVPSWEETKSVLARLADPDFWLDGLVEDVAEGMLIGAVGEAGGALFDWMGFGFPATNPANGATAALDGAGRATIKTPGLRSGKHWRIVPVE